MYPTDASLGIKINQLLLANNLENPADYEQIKKWQSSQQQELLQQQLALFLQQLGLYGKKEENVHTTKRLLDYWCKQLFYGLNYTNFPQINPLANEFAYSNPIIAEKIHFTTTCEHHLVPIHGVATIAYQPNQLLVGLNKLNCILEFFSHRPQLQERLTQQLFITLRHVLQTEHIAVLIKAKHDCMSTHGIHDPNSYHTTYQFGGIYEQDQTLKQHLLSTLS